MKPIKLADKESQADIVLDLGVLQSYVSKVKVINYK